MKIVKDERLMVEGLKHIRMAFILQNVMILGIVFYRYVVQGAGYESVSHLLMIFIGGIVVINFLNLKHSVEVYEHTGGVSRSYFMKLLLIPVGIVIGLLAICIIVTPGISIKEISITGLIMFVCFLIPSLFIYITLCSPIGSISKISPCSWKPNRL
ncbi:hypothetical protein ACQVTS_23800 [Bacillus mycoides]|uniref:hypothetical protein n=1 Tax=Bacillus mycoides TaxID=1405 RepID=UPI003D65A750